MDDEYGDDSTRWARPVTVAVVALVVLAGAFVARAVLTDPEVERFSPPPAGAADAPATTTDADERDATTTDAPTTTERRPTTGAPATSATASTQEPYETTPDGQPTPVLVLLDESSTRLSGTVPDRAAADVLALLAAATGSAQAEITDELTFNPDVPRSVAVRFVDLRSVGFPDGSADIGPVHARELDRIVELMEGVPGATATVVGHADQRGDGLINYALSEQRARAVVNYLVSRGIATSRLASRAVGEDELLTPNVDLDSLSLNRRTELVFSGLLVG